MEQTGYGPNRRIKGRVKKIFGPVVEMTVVEGGAPSRTQARIVDYNEGGFGFLAPQAVSPGSIVSFEDEGKETRRAKVAWCQKTRGGEFRIGVRFDVAEAADAGAEAEPEGGDADLPDYYELLQLSPKADAETIHRVYRLQAQRFHPDNKDTGDAAAFQLLHRAYAVLSDSGKRAGYDAGLSRIQRRRWKIFDKPADARGIEAEKRKRAGVLAILYSKRIQSPGSPSVSIAELENLLGVPKEHLEFALWYLRESGGAVRGDNAKFAITVRGADEVERGSGPEAGSPISQPDRLLA